MTSKDKNDRVTSTVKDVKKQNGDSIKIGLYLQTVKEWNNEAFDKAMSIVRESNIDILVLPEEAYIPSLKHCDSLDFMDEDDMEEVYGKALELSKDIGCAIVVCVTDYVGTIMSVYANAYFKENETNHQDYIKHTMTDFSACDNEFYQEYAVNAFTPIVYGSHKIGMTICYDCNHPMFSRKYGMNGVDIILSSTGGNVIYDKWYKYNKARAIENHCFTFVTMGGADEGASDNYVFGFTPDGVAMTPVLLNGKDSDRHNVAGGIYVYDTADYDGRTEVDTSIEQKESENKKIDLEIPIGKIDSFIKKGKPVAEGVRVVNINGNNIVLCLVDGDDIMKPEKVLKLLYAKELKKYNNKRYIIVNKWEHIDMDYYRSKLSVILKVRAMENYCAVIVDSDDLTKCFQTGQNRTAQVVKAVNGKFGIDLSRTGGPETIWKDKEGMSARWRDNIEWLIGTMAD